MVREFLGSAHPQTGGAKPYQMNALLAEMRDLDLTRGAVRRGPNVAEIARSQRDEWADEFLGAAGPSSVAWAGEFLDAGPSSRYGSDAPALDAELAEWDDQWDDLTSHLDNPNKSSLPATAGRVAQKLNDPRFAHSEVGPTCPSGFVGLHCQQLTKQANHKSMLSDEARYYIRTRNVLLGSSALRFMGCSGLKAQDELTIFCVCSFCSS